MSCSCLPCMEGRYYAMSTGEAAEVTCEMQFNVISDA
jgi:hypothetical protein